MAEGSNETIRTQLQHRSVRDYQDRPVPRELIDEILEAAQRTASSTGMQAASIIRVTDPARRRALSEVCNQDYVEKAPELWVLIVDLRRNEEILKEMGADTGNISNMYRFFQGYTDACLMAQSITTALESLGLGGVFLGSILNDPERTIDILKLPELTFPVLGIGFGYPSQVPQLKPRMDMSMRFFENEYEVWPGEYLERLRDYDEVMETYYDLRTTNHRSDSFTRQVPQKYGQDRPKRTAMLNQIRKQGFRLNLEEESIRK